MQYYTAYVKFYNLAMLYFLYVGNFVAGYGVDGWKFTLFCGAYSLHYE